MQKIDKTEPHIVSTIYKAWLDKLIADGESKDGGYNKYYDDVSMNLYKCQQGVCAYTEMRICIPELFDDANWIDGRHKLSEVADYKRNDHFGELDHYNPNAKKVLYWDWDNLFMVEAKINGLKSNHPVVAYLKPDLDDYSPEKYFDYDESTNRFIPNTDLPPAQIAEIQTMIDKVLFLNHGVVKNERRNYISELKSKKKRGEIYTVDRFFTSVRWSLI